MSLVCHSCAGDIEGNHVTCRGFCNATFHPKCSGISANSFDEVTKNNQVFWLCKSCAALMKDVRFRNAARSAHEVGMEQALNTHSDIMQNLKSEILSELKAELRSNFATLVNTCSFTPKSIRRVGDEPRATKRRRLFSTTDNTQRPPFLQGTGSTLSPSSNIAVVPVAQPKFWLYLSRIARDVSTDQVAAHAKKRLGSNDIQVVRLVAKGRDVNSLSFISFKVGMAPDLRMKALSTSTWPKGVVYREFTDNRSSENFWRPSQPPTEPPIPPSETAPETME